MADQETTRFFKVDDIPCREISDATRLVKDPLVSIMMISYNHAPYIAQAIEGVLMQQTDFPFELIIGEDRSTDRTREIVLQYQRKRPDIIRVLFSDHNVGMHKNSQRTIHACRGRYLAFCEGDDYWTNPNKLRMQVECLEANQNCGLVHSDYSIVNQQGLLIEQSAHTLWRNNLQLGQNAFCEILTKARAVGTCTVMVRRSLLLEAVTQDEDLRYESETMTEEKMGDLPLWLGLAARSQFLYIPSQLVAYRYAIGTASRPKRIEDRSAFKVSAGRIRAKFAMKYDCHSEVRAKVVRALFRMEIDHAFITGDKAMMERATASIRALGVGLSPKETLKYGITRWPWFSQVIRPYLCARHYFRDKSKEKLRGI